MHFRRVWQRAALAGAALATASCVPPDFSQLELAAAGSIGTPRLTPDLAALLSDERVFASMAAVRSASAAAPFRLTDGDPGSRRRALRCLTAAAYYEGRSESEEGQRAIVQVVLNRVRHYAYPSTICGVVFQGSDRRIGCQFSFTCDGSLDRRREPAPWRRAEGLAREAIDGSVYAPVGWATHYHRHDVRPAWASSLRALPAIGVHQFYVWQGSAGEANAFVRRSSSVEREPRPRSPEPSAAAAGTPAAVPDAAAPPGPVISADAESAPVHQPNLGATIVRLVESGRLGSSPQSVGETS
jgi:spore germination cell wall hydrolase CwlJ-like protein